MNSLIYHLREPTTTKGQATGLATEGQATKEAAAWQAAVVDALALPRGRNDQPLVGVTSGTTEGGSRDRLSLLNFDTVAFIS